MSYIRRRMFILIKSLNYQNDRKVLMNINDLCQVLAFLFSRKRNCQIYSYIINCCSVIAIACNLFFTCRYDKHRTIYELSKIVLNFISYHQRNNSTCLLKGLFDMISCWRWKLYINIKFHNFDTENLRNNSLQLSFINLDSYIMIPMISFDIICFEFNLSN